MSEAMWDALSSWFTPTVLFCLLNLVVATIFITSSWKTTSKKHEQIQSRACEDDMVQLFRAPSVLERIKSISFSRYRAEQPYPFPAETRYAGPNDEHVEKVKHGVQKQNMKGDDEEMESHVERSKSETCLEAPVKAGPAKMKKSESAKEKEGDHRRRPETTRESKGKWANETVSFGEDEAVDAKADDFINSFKQQLKLQRIESILRYKRK